MEKSEATIEDVYDIVKQKVGRQFNNIARFGEEREDVVQEVMLKVASRWDTFRGDCKVESWVHSIVTNTIINIGIKHGRTKRRSEGTLYIDHEEWWDVEDEAQDEMEEILQYNRNVMELVEYVEDNFTDFEKEVLKLVLKGGSATSVAKDLEIAYSHVTPVVRKIRELRL